MKNSNKDWGGFRKPIVKGDIKTKHEGHMSLTIEGENEVEQRRFIRYYSSLNRKQKRDLIRKQKEHRRFIRRENEVGFGGARSKAERIYDNKD